VDHIIPKNQGGSDDLSNLQSHCFRCNAAKRWEVGCVFSGLEGSGRVLLWPGFRPDKTEPELVVDALFSKTSPVLAMAVPLSGSRRLTSTQKDRSNSL
jgi:hypothetical protein